MATTQATSRSTGTISSCILRIWVQSTAKITDFLPDGFWRPDTNSDPAHTRRQIEDYGAGYPRFSSLIGAHAPFQIYRRFSQLRTRLILIKQDQLAVLEEQLEQIDESEIRGLFLSNDRRDRNPFRKQILHDIEAALSEYDSLIEKNCMISSYSAPQTRDVQSIKNWVEANACIASDETSYLAAAEHDLLCATPQIDGPVTQVEIFLQDAIIYVSNLIGKQSQGGISRDPNVHFFKGPLLKRITRALVASGVVTLLMMPVVLINAIHNENIRMIIVFVSITIVIMALAISTKITTRELFLAGATYATILVVFVSGNGN